MRDVNSGCLLTDLAIIYAKRAFIEKNGTAIFLVDHILSTSCPYDALVSGHFIPHYGRVDTRKEK
jgi:hypothetical protein